MITSAHWYDDVSDYPISPSGLESTNYDITFVDGTLHITPAPLTVRADDKMKLYGDPLPAFTASYSGFVMGQNPSVLGGALLLTTTADPSSHVGTYPIVPSDLTSTNYAITFTPGTLTITRTETTTTLDSSANPSTQGVAITFTATVSPASAGGTVAFKSDGGTVTGCAAQALTGGQASCTTSALPVGTHVITAEYGGDTNHNGSSGTLAPDQQVGPPTALQLTGFGAVPANRARFAPFALLLLLVLSVSLIVKQCAAGGSDLGK